MSECRHDWLQHRDNEGDAFRCLYCGTVVHCTCALHFTVWSPIHENGCQMRWSAERP